MFDNFPADKARDLMMLAGKGGSPSKNMGFAPQPVASSSASAEPKNPTSLAQPCPPRSTQTIVSACINHRSTPEHPARTCTLAAKEGEVCIWNRYRISHLSSIRQDDSVSSFQLFLCGFAAGTYAKAVCHPLDVVKKRFQVEH